MSGELEHKLVEVIGQLQAVAPKGVELALAAARINAEGGLLCGVIWLTVALVLAWFWWKVYWPWVHRKEQDYVDGPIASFLSGAVLVLLLSISVGSALEQLSDIWNYVGIFHPELALAHKFI